MSDPLLKLDSFLPYKLSLASNLVSDVIAESYQKLFALKVPEWRVLAVIAEAGRPTQLEIGQRTGMDKVTVSRATLAMEARGLIVRCPNPADGRSHLLTLSHAGIALYRQVVPQARELEAVIFDSLDELELVRFSSILDRIRSTARAYLVERDAKVSSLEG